MPPPTDEQARAWLASREIGFTKLARNRADRLRELDDSKAVETFEKLYTPAPDARRVSLSGLITQQAWFSRGVKAGALLPLLQTR